MVQERMPPGVWRLDEGDSRFFKSSMEFSQDIQFAKIEGCSALVVVFGALVVIDFEQLRPHVGDFLQQPWYRSEISYREASREFETWIDKADIARSVEYKYVSRQQATTLNFVFNPFPAAHTFPSIPGAPPPYGHLPLGGTTSHGEKYYRFEAFPTSRRLVGNAIDVDTFASPESEIHYVPTGLSAVGRLALPSFLPAIFRREIQPDPVLVRCGAVVPQFGQAGGGVEVCFHMGGTNTVYFPPPTVLPAL